MKVLIVVDMQNDFIDGALGTPEAQGIVSQVIDRIKASKDELIIFTQDTHGEDYLATPEGKKLPVVHCVAGTHGWQVKSEILQAWRDNDQTMKAPELKDNTITKPIFGSTDLVDYLKGRADQISRIELLGVCTDICVVSNALLIKNHFPQLDLYVNQACCAGATPETHQAALSVMKMCQIDVF